jgi:hypothetical protein
MLGSAVDAGLADAGLRAKLANLGAVPMPMTRVEFRKLIADEVEKWAESSSSRILARNRQKLGEDE